MGLVQWDQVVNVDVGCLVKCHARVRAVPVAGYHTAAAAAPWDRHNDNQRLLGQHFVADGETMSTQAPGPMGPVISIISTDVFGQDLDGVGEAFDNERARFRSSLPGSKCHPAEYRSAS